MLAEEMNVRSGIAVITHIVVIDGYHLCHTMLGKETERVVDRGQAQAGNLCAKPLVHIFHCWVCVVRHNVFAYRNAWL